MLGILRIGLQTTFMTMISCHLFVVFLARVHVDSMWRIVSLQSDVEGLRQKASMYEESDRECTAVVPAGRLKSRTANTRLLSQQDDRAVEKSVFL